MTTRATPAIPNIFYDSHALSADLSSLITYLSTPHGIEDFVAASQQTCKLYTFRQQPRRFKSAETALRVAKTIGVPSSIWNVHPTNPSHRRLPIKKEILS